MASRWLSLAAQALAVSLCLPSSLALSTPTQLNNIASELTAAASVLSSSQPSTDVSAALSAISNASSSINSVTGSGNSLASNAATGTSESFTSAQIACAVIKFIFPGNYVDASSANYTAEEDQNWSTNCWLPAACFVLPRNTVEAAITLKIITLTGSKFATRSGGHNQNVGFASIDGSGVLIDMQRMNKLQLANTNSILRTGPGNSWADVYSYLDPYGISAIGARNPMVGVAGQLLGGGASYFFSLYGWGCDNVRNFEVILGNSSVVNASPTSNPDLYKALKGGASNFGIVTRFDLYTRPLHNVWYTFVAYSVADYAAVLNALAQTQLNMESDPKASFLMQGTAAQGIFLAAFLYAEWTSQPAVFAPFANVTPLATFLPPTNGTILTLSQAFNIPAPVQSHYITAQTSKVSGKAYIDAWNNYLTYHNYSSDPSSTMSFSFSVVGGNTASVSARTGGNSLGIQSVPQTRKFPLFWKKDAQIQTPAHVPF
jgi:hypothetical protein